MPIKVNKLPFVLIHCDDVRDLSVEAIGIICRILVMPADVNFRDPAELKEWLPDLVDREDPPADLDSYIEEALESKTLTLSEETR